MKSDTHEWTNKQTCGGNVNFVKLKTCGGGTEQGQALPNMVSSSSCFIVLDEQIFTQDSSPMKLLVKIYDYIFHGYEVWAFPVYLDSAMQM